MTVAELAQELGTQTWVLGEFAQDIITWDGTSYSIEITDDDVQMIREAWDSRKPGWGKH